VWDTVSEPAGSTRRHEGGEEMRRVLVRAGLTLVGAVAVAALGVGSAAAAVADGVSPIPATGTSADNHQMKHLANDHHLSGDPAAPKH
jgi:hypothetical protein